MIVFDTYVNLREAQGEQDFWFRVERKTFACELDDLPQAISKMKEVYPDGYFLISFNKTYQEEHEQITFPISQNETSIPCKVVYHSAANQNYDKFLNYSHHYLIKIKDFHDFFEHKKRCFNKFSIVFKPDIEENCCKVVENCTDI